MRGKEKPAEFLGLRIRCPNTGKEVEIPPDWIDEECRISPHYYEDGIVTKVYVPCPSCSEDHLIFEDDDGSDSILVPLTSE